MKNERKSRRMERQKKEGCPGKREEEEGGEGREKEQEKNKQTRLNSASYLPLSLFVILRLQVVPIYLESI